MMWSTTDRTGVNKYENKNKQNSIQRIYNGGRTLIFTFIHESWQLLPNTGAYSNIKTIFSSQTSIDPRIDPCVDLFVMTNSVIIIIMWLRMWWHIWRKKQNQYFYNNSSFHTVFTCSFMRTYNCIHIEN